MSDVRLKYDPADQTYDIDIVRGDIEMDDGLESAVLISLFTDARIETDELRAGETERRGWWGDAVENTEGTQTGSKLWNLIDRGKIDDDLLDDVETEANAALAWMVEDRVAGSVDVTAERIGTNAIAITVVVTRPNGQTVNLKFNNIWEARTDGIRSAFVG